jgi:Tol biopolymer transport system component
MILLFFVSACIKENDIETVHPLISYSGLSNGSNARFIADFNGNNILKFSDNFVFNPQFSPSEPIICYMESDGNDYNTYLYNYETDLKTHISNNPDFDHSYSSDGSKIVFKSSRDSIEGIYIMESDGSNQLKLTDDSYIRYDLPIISTISNKVAYLATDYEVSFVEYWIMDINGDNNQKIMDLPSMVRQHQFYDNGEKILFTEFNGQLFSMNIDGTNLVQLTENGINDEFALSPDESLIVISSLRENTRTLYRINIDGTNLTQLTTDEFIDTNPNFTNDGLFIVYNSIRNESRIYVIDLNGENESEIISSLSYDVKVERYIQ